jgi:hypothetical protein
MGPFTKKVGEPYQKSGYVYWLPKNIVKEISKQYNIIRRIIKMGLKLTNSL